MMRNGFFHIATADFVPRSTSFATRKIVAHREKSSVRRKKTDARGIGFV
jgi:hypothetical protein